MKCIKLMPQGIITCVERIASAVENAFVHVSIMRWNYAARPCLTMLSLSELCVTGISSCLSEASRFLEANQRSILNLLRNYFIS